MGTSVTIKGVDVVADFATIGMCEVTFVDSLRNHMILQGRECDIALNGVMRARASKYLERRVRSVSDIEEQSGETQFTVMDFIAGYLGQHLGAAVPDDMDDKAWELQQERARRMFAVAVQFEI